MKHFNLKKFFAVSLTAICCANAFAYWGHRDPIIDNVHDIPTYWNYETNKWMKDVADDTPIGKITMISSHDAGMDEDNTTPHTDIFTSTQYHSFIEQMRFGARFFDVRVCKCRNGKYYAYHASSYGLCLDNMLDDAVEFLKKDSTEVVIIKLSHWWKPEQAYDCIKMVMGQSKWTDHFYKSDASTPPVLNEVPLKDLRGKIILLMDYPGGAKQKPENANFHELAQYGYTPKTGLWHFSDLTDGCPGRYGYYRIYDSYANAQRYSTMLNDQTNKWDNFLRNFNVNTDSFMFCWQLTPPGIPFSFANTINPLLDENLSHLCAKFNNHPNFVNIDFIDFRICKAAINLNHVYVKGAYNKVRYLDASYSSDEVKYYSQVCSEYNILKGVKDDPYELNSGWYVVDGTCTCNQGILVKGDAKIILTNGSKLVATGGSYNAGIQVDKAHYPSLKIYAQTTDSALMGELKAVGGYEAAGIGGSYNQGGGYITIYGGKITAEGGSYGAGIGGGCYGAGESLEIYGGIVEAKSSSYAAGIGGGYDQDGKYITLYGGSVTATGSSGGAGIGGGYAHSSKAIGSDIYIYGGDIKATGGAGIGGGRYGNAQRIHIYGGKILVNANDWAAGIGGGYGGSAEDLNIYGGNIRIEGNQYGAGIGGGCYKNGGGRLKGLWIRGGTIFIENVSDAYDIGGGWGGSAEDIYISGGSIWPCQAGKKIDNPKCDGRPVYELTVKCADDGDKVNVYGLKDYGVKDIYKISNELKLWVPDGNYKFSTDRYRYDCTVSGGPAITSGYNNSIVVNIGQAGFATIYSDYRLEVPEDVRMFTYTYDNSKQKLIPKEVPAKSILPANQGYVLMGKQGPHIIFTSNEPSGPYSSDLTGVTEVTAKGSRKVFGLGNIDGVTAFYEYKDDNLKPGKAYYIMMEK